MIMCNLRTLLAERGLTATKVSEDTGVSRTTLGALYNSSGQGIQFETLNTLCGYLGVEPGDLFTFFPIEITLEKFHFMRDSISFMVVEVGKMTRMFTLPLDVDVEYEHFVEDDPMCIADIPLNATIRIGSLHANDEEPSKEEKTFWRYFDKLPVSRQAKIENEIEHQVASDLFEILTRETSLEFAEKQHCEIDLAMDRMY